MICARCGCPKGDHYEGNGGASLCKCLKCPGYRRQPLEFERRMGTIPPDRKEGAMVSNDWIARDDREKQSAIAWLVYEAGQETGAVLAGAQHQGLKFSLEIVTREDGVLLLLDVEERLPADLERALGAAVRRCTRGPLELTITQPRIVKGSGSSDRSVHTWSVQNGVRTLELPKHNILGAKAEV